MNGMIDEKGFLLIERGDIMKAQICPMTRTDGCARVCGDWCPLFGDPEPELHRYNDLDGKPTGKTLLSLCHTTLTLYKLYDYREDIEESHLSVDGICGECRAKEVMNAQAK